MTGVALLGSGFMGSIHAASYAAIGADVKVVAGDDAERVAEQLGAQAVGPWEAALEVPGVDAVDVCVPTPLHREVAERALAAGKHVLIEKPIALSLEDADAIAAAADGRVLMVGHVLRHVPEIVELRRVVESGELGHPLAASATRLSAPPDWNDWMLDEARSGGTVVDLAIHDFDILAELLGPCARVHARAVASRRHVTVLAEHERGEGLVEASHAMPASYPFTASLRVLCERGVAEHRLVAGAADEFDAAVLSALTISPADGKPRRFSEAADPWRRQIEHFLACIEAGAEPRDGSFAQARAALAVALAAGRSLESGLLEPV